MRPCFVPPSPTCDNRCDGLAEELYILLCILYTDFEIDWSWIRSEELIDQSKFFISVSSLAIASVVVVPHSVIPVSLTETASIL